MLIMIDQQRWDTLSCADGTVETVNLDWLAADGTRFTHAYSATPSCVPATVDGASIGRAPLVSPAALDRSGR